MTLSIPRPGLVPGCLVAGLDALWALMVASGWAQPFLDLIFWLYFVTPPYRVEPFDLGRALALVTLTGGLGFLGGAALALAWNKAGPGRT